MFANIYYDHRKNKIHLWEYKETGRRHHEIINYVHDYYVLDKLGSSPIKDIYGIPVVAKSTDEPYKLKTLRESNVYMCESDIQKDVAFLHKRYEKIPNFKPVISNFNICYLDIEIACENTFPKPEDANFPINLITVKISKTGEMWTFGLQEMSDTTITKNYVFCPDEKELMVKFVEFFKKQKVDVLSGWNCTGFDVPYLINRFAKLGIEQNLSPLDIWECRFDKMGEWQVSIAGISVLDYMLLYKKFTRERKESYSLNFICKEELKEGKLDFDGLINDLWKLDWNKFVEYNIQDVLLLEKLDLKLKYIALTITMAYDALVPLDRVKSSISMLTGYILKFLHLQNRVMPDKKDIPKEEYPGAYVYCKEGFYEEVMSFDVVSLYPHILMGANISPETLLHDGDTDRKEKLEKEGNLIKTPVEGVYYDKSKKGVIPEVVKDIFDNRVKYKKLFKEAKKNGDVKNEEYFDRMQYCMKILANALYGSLGNEYFHFYNVDNARAVTLFGQDIIKFLSNHATDYFTNYYLKDKKLEKDFCILIDTDSNFYHLKELKSIIAPDKSFLDFALDFDKTVMTPFFKKVLKIYSEKYNTLPVIDFRRDKIIEKLMVQAKKKYAYKLLADEDGVLEKPKLKITGIETVRSDTPRYCRDKLLEAINIIFDTANKSKVMEYLKKIKVEFKKQPIEDVAFPRGVSDYQKYSYESKNGGLAYPPSTPIHVRASLNGNYLNNKYGLKMNPIDNGTKIKFIFVLPQNCINQNVVGFVGKWPDKYNSLFKIDWEKQWEGSFQNKIERFFTCLGWGDVNLTNDNLSKFMKF